MESCTNIYLDAGYTFFAGKSITLTALCGGNYSQKLLTTNLSQIVLS